MKRTYKKTDFYGFILFAFIFVVWNFLTYFISMKNDYLAGLLMCIGLIAFIFGEIFIRFIYSHGEKISIGNVKKKLG